MSKPLQDINSLGQAHKSDEEKEDKRSQAQIDYDEGRGYVERGESAMAAVSLHNALRAFEEEGNQEAIANCANQLGHACLQRSDFEKALINFQRAWDICDDLGDAMSLHAISLQFVHVYKGMKNYRKSLDVCLDLLDAYQKNNDPRGSVGVLELMAEVYLESGDREKAADAYRTVASIHDNFNHETIAESFRQKAAELSA